MEQWCERSFKPVKPESWKVHSAYHGNTKFSHIAILCVNEDLCKSLLLTIFGFSLVSVYLQ